jgi:hypothetical protein
VFWVYARQGLHFAACKAWEYLRFNDAALSSGSERQSHRREHDDQEPDECLGDGGVG